ncbi:response regulator [Reichenbachiella carrageenanivorans]|uniref:Response regulator n=1 Tax=Reichenbachiella carrageenanivorans TaxID=2979869 RepID=A0ABY6D1R7_9BACT|nr:response regulator [Reichenbachiella carrageenanivorans]UXX80107.1 response regulator [Reichenbachiella carrageenanivorans]
MNDLEMADIVLVEDNPNDAEITIRSLKKHNLANKLIWLKDGVEALDYLLAKGTYASRDPKKLPRVVFLDLKLPKIDGMEVLEEIRNNELTKKIPVVVLTSSKEEQDVVKTYNLGVNSYIVKPVEFENFAKAIAEVGFYWLVTNTTPSV